MCCVRRFLPSTATNIFGLFSRDEMGVLHTPIAQSFKIQRFVKYEASLDGRLCRIILSISTKIREQSATKQCVASKCHATLYVVNNNSHTPRPRTSMRL